MGGRNVKGRKNLVRRGSRSRHMVDVLGQTMTRRPKASPKAKRPELPLRFPFDKTNDTPTQLRCPIENDEEFDDLYPDEEFRRIKP